MPKYISTCKLSTVGETNIGKVVATIKTTLTGCNPQIYLTMGHYDLVVISSHAEDARVLRALLSLAQERASFDDVKTMRAFDEDEYKNIQGTQTQET